MRTLLQLTPVRRAGLAVAALALLAAPLRADTVTADHVDISPARSVSVKLGVTNWIGLDAGFVNWNYVSGATQYSPTFSSFCIELEVGIEPTTTFTETSLTPRFSDEMASRLKEFWGEHFGEIAGDPNGAAAFQLGIWEIVNETGALDLTADNFQVLLAGKSPTDPAILALAQGWLATIDGVGTFEENLIVLDSEKSQDQITTTVPVPPAAVFGAMGLVSLVGYGLRRRRAAAAVATEAQAG